MDPAPRWNYDEVSGAPRPPPLLSGWVTGNCSAAVKSPGPKPGDRLEFDNDPLNAFACPQIRLRQFFAAQLTSHQYCSRVVNIPLTSQPSRADQGPVVMNNCW